MSNTSLKSFTLFAVIVLFSSCSASKKLTSILIENSNGNVELIYAGNQLPNNLVKEIKFFPNGDTLSVTPMLKGAVNGVVSFYSSDNKLKEQTTFENGVQNGVFKRFDLEGVLVLEGKLKAGKKVGVWTTWYDEVQKQEEKQYVDNLEDGKWTYWFIDGSVKREEVYKLGKLIEEKDFN